MLTAVCTGTINFAGQRQRLEVNPLTVFKIALRWPSNLNNETAVKVAMS